METAESLVGRQRVVGESGQQVETTRLGYGIEQGLVDGCQSGEGQTRATTRRAYAPAADATTTVSTTGRAAKVDGLAAISIAAVGRTSS